MFYGIPPNKQQKFQQAIEDIANIYPNQVYAQDMLIAIGRNLSFRQDRKFMDSYEAIATETQERSLLWRLHVMVWAAKNALRVEGDFVECGVFKGTSSSVICKYLDFADLSREFYLYDTFNGLPEETSSEQERAGWNPAYQSFDSDALYQEVCDTFSPYPNVHVIRGIVPNSFEQAMPKKIALLHIDMNSEKAEMLALEALFDKITTGGFIVLDDFGWTSHQKQMIAEWEFLTKRGHHILELPTGQAVIIKHD